MPHPGDDVSAAEPTADRMMLAVSCLSSVDVLANIFGFLHVKDIMRNRRVNKKWKEAVKITIIPPTYFSIVAVKRYNAMNVMTTEMPNLQQIAISDLEYGHKWSVGEDPDEEWAGRTADWRTYDIEIISNFSKLKILDIHYAGLNGRYPFLFNSFPMLQKLYIDGSYGLKWDLEMLAELPLLKELDCGNNHCLTGNINSLRVLKETLEKVHIKHCRNVEGNFMDLADFPHLKELNLLYTAVTGDIRDIGKNDFSSLEELDLGNEVYGGRGYELQRISEATDLVAAVYLLKKQRPALKMKNWYGKLSEDSTDWYRSMISKYPSPFTIRLIKVGSRLGYRWLGYRFETDSHIPCAVNWLDPEPDKESTDYEEYIAKLEEMNTYEVNNEVQLYRGFHQPPTEEEYQSLIEALPEESDGGN